MLPSADRASGFVSNEERQGFYQVLLELGKTKGVRSPVAWSAAIIKSIDNGDPCQYLTEYREGLLVGACEKQEWEIAPGQPYEQFVTYLKTKNKKTGMTDEEAIAAAHHQLKDVNLTKSLWESCKRAIAKYQEDWEQQKRLGVQNAYLPPELLPERHVSLEEITDARNLCKLAVGSYKGLQSLHRTPPCFRSSRRRRRPSWSKPWNYPVSRRLNWGQLVNQSQERNRQWPNCRTN